MYRPEIDGLRALAVIPVILFHFGIEFLGGGFVGVDIFFVISGYLITTILIEDIENKCFSILNFYERRARRILPALFFVMTACIPFSWMWMVPSQMEEFSQSLIAVSLFVYNIFAWRKVGYFATEAEEKPFLHTWSLAVEEQFYLLFPIFLLSAWRFGKSRVFWMIVIMAAISLLISEWGWRNKATANYYLTVTRAWEVLSGSIVAFIIQKNGVKKNNVLAFLGLSAIIFSLFAYNETIPFPSVYTLVPVVGTILIILNADRTTLVAKLLSSKVLVGVGLISYSAYLWHQPLFAFAKIRWGGELSINFLLTQLLLTGLLAYFTWRFVEQPLRDRVRISSKSIFSLSLIGIVGFVAYGLVTPKMIENFLYSREVIAQHKLSSLANDYIWKAHRQLKNKSFSENNTKKILVIGDSNSGDLINTLSFLTHEADVELSAITIHSGCGAVFMGDHEYEHNIKSSLKEVCRNSDNLLSNRSENLMNEADVVIFASEWWAWQVELLSESRQRLETKFGNKFWWFGNKHIKFPSERDRMLQKGVLSVSYPIRNEKQRLNDQMQKILGDRFINPYHLLCSGGQCRVFNEDREMLTHDGFHLTEDGARHLASQMRKLLPTVLDLWLTNKGMPLN